MTGNTGKPEYSTGDTVPTGGLTLPLQVCSSPDGNAPWTVVENDASLGGAIARQTVLEAANPGTSYGVFQNTRTRYGVISTQVA